MEVVNRPQVIGQQPVKKAEAPEAVKKTTLDKAVDVVKENTKKGTLVGDHYIATTAGTLVGATAAGALIAKTPVLRDAFDIAFVKPAKVWGGAIGVTTAAVLAEDAVQSFKEGSTFKATSLSVGAAVTGLGGVELLGRQFNVPVAKEALSGTAEFLGKNAAGVVGAGAAAGGAYAIKHGVEKIQEGKTGQGAAIAAGGAVGVLGGAELIGRQFDIPVLKDALTGPAKAVFNSKGGKVAAGAAVAATGAAAAIDGVRRLSTGKGLGNDLIGMAETTAGVAAAAGGTSLIGMGVGSEKLTQALPQAAHFVGATAAAGAAVALGKFTVQDLKENGITLTNTAAGMGSAIAGLGAASIIGDKLGVVALEKALKKGWQPVVGVGAGVMAYKFGASSIEEAKAGNYGNAAGKAGLSIVAGATSAATLGDAFNIPVLETFGEKAISAAEKVVEPVFNFATKNPVLTLGALAVAGGAGAYMYYRNKDDEQAAQATQQPEKK